MTRRTEWEETLLPMILPFIDQKKAQDRVDEVCKCYLDAGHPEHEKLLRAAPIIEFSIDINNYSLLVSLTVARENALAFYLEPYPACCAIQMFHHFQCSTTYVTEENLHKILDIIFQNVAPKIGHWASRRLQVMMVSRNPKFEDEQKDHQFGEVTASLEPNYPELYRYFKKQKKCNETLMWNKNTGNIIHELEVLFDTEKFDRRSQVL